VHRLDRETTGLVVYGRTNETVSELQRQFRMRIAKKLYVALVCGHMQANEGEIDLPISRESKESFLMRVATPESESLETYANILLDPRQRRTAKTSFTTFEVISRESLGEYPVTRVALYPETGRTHQLRVHCAAIGHPIVADPIYGWGGVGPQNAGFADVDMDFVYPSRANDKVQREIAAYAESREMRLCLHAQQLNLWHPLSRAPLILRAPPPF